MDMQFTEQDYQVLAKQDLVGWLTLCNAKLQREALATDAEKAQLAETIAEQAKELSELKKETDETK